MTKATLPSAEQLTQLARGGLDHLSSRNVEWNGFDAGLRSGLLAFGAKDTTDRSEPELPTLPTILELVEKKEFSDFVAAFYAAGTDKFDVRILAGTHLPDELQYFWALAMPPAAKRPPGMNSTEEWHAIQLEMIATWVRLMGMYPSLGAPGATASGSRPAVAIRATRNDWANAMPIEAAFDAVALIATDFYRMLPKRISTSNTFTFQITGAAPDSKALMSREITLVQP